MRFGDRKAIRGLRFTHENTEFNYVYAHMNENDNSVILEPENTLHITFSDLQEVDNLICALEMFKESCADSLGYWKKQRR